MRMRCAGLALSLSAVLAASAFGAGDRETPARMPAVEALRPGDRCRVELNPTMAGRVETVLTYDGAVATTDEHDVGLIVESTRRVDIRKGFLARVAPPALSGRLFRNVGIGRSEPGKGPTVSIPRASIRSVERLENEDKQADLRVPTPDFAAGRLAVDAPK